AVVAAGPDRSVPMSLRTARTGVLPVFRVDHISAGHDELLATEPARSGPLQLVVRPASRPMRQLPLPFRLQGLTGAHPSRRVGGARRLPPEAPVTAALPATGADRTAPLPARRGGPGVARRARVHPRGPAAPDRLEGQCPPVAGHRVRQTGAVVCPPDPGQRRG